MLFDKEKYYNYTQKLKNKIGYIISINTILITILLFCFVGIVQSMPEDFQSIVAFILILIIAYLINYTAEKIEKIEVQIQEMNWKLDLYDKITQKEEN